MATTLHTIVLRATQARIRNHQPIPKYDQLVLGSPWDASVWVLRARYAASDYECLRNYNEAIRVMPHHAEALHLRGRCYLSMGRPSCAQTDLDRAVRLRPNYASLWNDLGVAVFALTEIARAIQYYTRALAIDRGLVCARKNRAQAYCKMGNAVAAIADYGELIRVRPANPDFWKQRARCFESTHDFAAAVRHYDEVLALTPHDTDARAHRAFGHIELGLTHTAIAALVRVVVETPGWFLAWSWLVLAYLKDKQWASAMQCTTMALLIRPQSAQVWTLRGVAAANMRKWEGAITDFETALRYCPGHRRATRYLSMVRAHLQQQITNA